jgi:hypothetical protein
MPNPTHPDTRTDAAALAAEARRLADFYAQQRSQNYIRGTSEARVAVFDAIDRLAALAQRPESTSERAQRAADAALIAAAHAVVARWDTPLWKDAPATGEFINRLRRSLEDHPAPKIPLSCRDSHEASLKYVEGYEAGVAAARAQRADVPDIIAGALQTSRAHAYELMEESLAARAQGAEVDEAKEREAFEGEMRPRLAPQFKRLARWNDTGDYVMLDVQRAWEGWLARAHHAGQVEEAVRRDAERYRIWRDLIHGPNIDNANDDPLIAINEANSASELDAACDAARAQLGGKGGGDADAS